MNKLPPRRPPAPIRFGKGDKVWFDMQIFEVVVSNPKFTHLKGVDQKVLTKKLGLYKRAPYQPPKPRFKPGDKVQFEGKAYEIEASTHTHSQLKGVLHAIPNSYLRKIRTPLDR